MTNQYKVLVVEDDQRLALLIQDYLQSYDFRVVIENRGDKANDVIINECPDIVILDLMLPGKDGFDICRTAREVYLGPILILTAREDDTDQVVGLELGADDFVKKPIEPRVLLARIKALLRRSRIQRSHNLQTNQLGSKHVMEFGSLHINSLSHTVIFDKSQIEITTSEFELLWILASNAGKIMNRDELFHELRGIDYDGIDRSIDIIISRIRKKLEVDPDNPQRIKTVWRKGYLFVEDAWVA